MLDGPQDQLGVLTYPNLHFYLIITFISNMWPYLFLLKKKQANKNETKQKTCIQSSEIEEEKQF